MTKTKAVRLYGANDLRLEEFELPEIKEDEILAKVVTDSICMSSYKAAHQGIAHKRVPNDVEKNPIIIGHEFAGEIVEVGSKWSDDFKAGDKFSIQPAINDDNGPVGVLSAPGYSYQFIGGDATYIIIPSQVMESIACWHMKGKATSRHPCRNHILVLPALFMPIIIQNQEFTNMIWGLLKVAKWPSWPV